MRDPRTRRLAELLLDYSIGLKKGETLYLEWKGSSTIDLAKELIAQTVKRGATCFPVFHDEQIIRPLLEKGTAEQIKAYASLHCHLMEKSRCYIGINGSDNPFEMASVPIKQTDLFIKNYSVPVHNVRRMKKTRWCVMRWPSRAFAQMAQMSHDEFTDFYFDVCLVDYKRLSKKMSEISRMLSGTDNVRIVSPDTDLTFSIKGMKNSICDGHLNIPDGEIFTAPIADSINGTIKFNTPTLYRGTVFNNIRLTFKNGVAHHATCDGNDKLLNDILNIDKGARQCGEFAIGLNPKIKKPMKETLFDEKIDGSVHMAMGQCYDDVPNGVKSANHWDIVLIQTKEYGGGELYFDGKLVRKNGKFV